MFTASHRRLAAVVLAGMFAFVLGVPSLEAQGPPLRLVGGFGGDAPKTEDQPDVTLHVTPEVTGPLARTWAKLQKPLKMPFPDETPFDDILKYVKQETQEKGDKGIPIYVDPIELQEAEKSMTSPVASINLEGVPLATSLGLVLKQLGMTYYVQEDGLLVVVSESGDRAVEPESQILEDLDSLRKELSALHDEMVPGRKQRAVRPSRTPPSSGSQVSQTVFRRIAQFGGLGGAEAPDENQPPTRPVKTVRLTAPLSARAAETWLRLRQPIPIPFDNETPLEEVISYIKKTTKPEGAAELQVYVDPIGLQSAEKTMTSPVKMSMDGIPLSTSLKLMLKQIDLRYYVQRDGIIMITEEESEDAAVPGDASAKILDQISMLRNEVAALRDLKTTGGAPRGTR